MASSLTVRELSLAQRGGRNRFIDVPFRLYPPDSLWVSPPRLSLHRLLNPKKNPFFQHAEMVGFVAEDRGRPVGRIAAIVNHLHNQFHRDRVGFFGFFETIPSREVAAALLDAAAAWLRARDRDTMRGPVNPSTNDECGMLIDAFDKPPMIMMPYNPPYYPELIEEYGFTKAKDLYAYEMYTQDGMSPRVLRLAEAVRRRTKARLRPIDLKRLRQELPILKEIYSRAWEKNWGFVPLTDEEIDFIAMDLREAAEPDCCQFVFIEDEPVGFCAAVYNLNQVFAKLRNGRLFPFGIWTYLREKRKIDALRVLLLGVVAEHRGRGLDVLMYTHIFGVAEQKGYRWGEFSWILEDNYRMNEAAQAMGARRYKTYRIYDYPLEPS